MDELELSSFQMTKNDIHFLKQLVEEAKEWQKYECKPESLTTYVDHYKLLGGEWRIWTLKEQRVAVSYHLKDASSNKKPWLGTLLVSEPFRGMGVGKNIVKQLVKMLKERKKTIFVACPIEQEGWIRFLGKCGFEQFKVEKNVDRNTFLIFVHP